MMYLIAVHHPIGYDPTIEEGPGVHAEIDKVNDDMIKAGVRFFAGGLQPIATAHTISRSASGDDVISNEPCLKSDPILAGFWIVDVASHEEAIEWGKKALNACRNTIEVRPFY